ncbi:MAG: glycine betaine/L-proline ABC transporter substrate-binding protein ProX [Halothece sp.]
MTLLFRKAQVFLIIAITVTSTIIGLNSCQNQPISEEITPAYVSLEERFQTEIVNIGLEKLGYKINPMRELEPALMHTDIATGGIDYSAAHWQQIGQEFYNNSGGDDKLEKVGVIIDNAVQGYLIDSATAKEYNITNLEQLQDPEIAQLFDSNGNGKANLIGCNPGWGCETIIDHHLESYGLKQTVEHEQGKYVALMADVVTRYQQNEPILYYTWTPLWTSGVLVPGEDVKWLEVPYTSLPDSKTSEENSDTTYEGKNLGFVTDQIMIIANKNFAQSNPVAVEFMKQVRIPIEDINAQNQRLREGEDSASEIRRHAENWISKNQETFQQWLEINKRQTF